MGNSNTTLTQPQITAIDTNTLLVHDKSTLKLLERFMNYPEGYLSHKITWNDIMPVVSKVKFISKPFQKWLIWKELDNYLLPVYNSLTESDNKGVLVSIINFINWFDLVKPCYQNN